MKTDLAIIKIPNLSYPILANLDSESPVKYYKYPSFAVSWDNYTVLDIKDLTMSEDEYSVKYSLEYVAPTLRSDIITMTNGWLSPDGELYSCKFDDINMIAMALHIIRYNQIGFETDLDDKWWGLILYTGRFSSKGTPTLKQLQTLKTIILDNRRTTYSYTLWKDVRGYLEDNKL